MWMKSSQFGAITDNMRQHEEKCIMHVVKANSVAKEPKSMFNIAERGRVTQRALIEWLAILT